MSVTQSITQWLHGFKGLNGRLDVNALDQEAESYSVDVVPCQEVIKQYMDGSSIRQFQFAVSSRRYHDQNIAQNLASLQFFEDLTAWAETAPLPVMDAGKTARKIVVTSSAYPFTVSDNGTARYQTQMRLEYYQEGER